VNEFQHRVAEKKTKGTSEVLMRHRVIVLIAALALLNSPTAPAQSKEHSPDDLLARLSYSSTYFWDVNEGRSPQNCLALYHIPSDGRRDQSRLSSNETARCTSPGNLGPALTLVWSTNRKLSRNGLTEING
jgi:hypothetical protein